MKRYNLKFKAVSLSVLLMVLASLAGCTAADILTLKTVDESVGEAQIKRFSPTYYMDEQFDGYSSGPPVTAQRIAPSYYLDDPALVEGVAGVPSIAIAQFSPSYHLDDPTLTESINTAIEIISSLFAVRQ
jgi:hypothetical protein